MQLNQFIFSLRGASRWIAVLMVAGLLLTTSLNLDHSIFTATASTFQTCPSVGADRIQVLRDFLPSILIDSAVTDYNAINDIASIYTAGEGPNVQLPQLTIPIGPNADDTLTVDLELNTALINNGFSRVYGGSLDTFNDSLVSLTVRHRDFEGTNVENRLSGFLIMSLDDEDNKSLSATENWYVLEPIRPLLRSVMQSRLAGQNCDIDSYIDSEYPQDQAWTIVYEARNTNFTLQLDPFRIQPENAQPKTIDTADQHGGKSDALGTSPNYLSLMQGFCGTDEGESCPVDLTIVFDKEFEDLKGSFDEAISDIQAVMSNFVRKDGSNLYSDFQADVDLSLRISPVRYDPSFFDRFVAPSTGEPVTPHAFELLCAYIEDEPNTAVGHHDSDQSTIYHLFTGYDLAVVPPDLLGADPEEKTISDSGDGFCDNYCDRNDIYIVGLAQGLGGAKNPQSTNSNGCTTTGFSTAGHHSLSQHKAKAEAEAESDSMTKHFDGNLLQRWVLVAHELAHNLGAKHVDTNNDIKSIMHSLLSQGTLNYYLELDSANDINSPGF